MMKKAVLLSLMLFAGYSGIYAQSKPAAKKPVSVPAPQTTCYMSSEDGGKHRNLARIIIDGSKVSGELRYLSEGEKPAEGTLSGTIKDGIITADWIFVKDGGYLKVPVSLKVTSASLWQKRSAVNEKGEPYIPEDAKFEFEFPKIDCKDYPVVPLKDPKDKVKISIRQQ